MFWTRFSVEKDQMPCIIVESQFAEAFDEKMGTVVLKASDVTGSHFTKGFKQRKCIYVHDFEDLIFETIHAPQWL